LAKKYTLLVLLFTLSLFSPFSLPKIHFSPKLYFSYFLILDLRPDAQAMPLNGPDMWVGSLFLLLKVKIKIFIFFYLP